MTSVLTKVLAYFLVGLCYVSILLGVPFGITYKVFETTGKMFKLVGRCFGYLSEVCLYEANCLLAGKTLPNQPVFRTKTETISVVLR